MSRAARAFRSALSTQPSPGGPRGSFTLPCRKLVIEYCEKSAASKGTRDYLLQNAAHLARTHPSTEIVVLPRPQRAPLLRGFYRTCARAVRRVLTGSERADQGDLHAQPAGV